MDQESHFIIGATKSLSNIFFKNQKYLVKYLYKLFCYYLLKQILKAAEKAPPSPPPLNSALQGMGSIVAILIP
jgi:hypothetical protein